MRISDWSSDVCSSDLRLGRVARIELNRPDAMNAIDQAMKAALLGALERAARDPEIGAVILTGAGKAFCTGTDLKSAAAIDGDARRIARTLLYDYQPILDRQSTRLNSSNQCATRMPSPS